MSMRWQAFGLGKTLDRPGDSPQTAGRKLLNRNQLAEIENAQSSAKSSLPGSRQHMVGARGVIARSLRRVVTDKDRARILDEWHIVFGDGDVLRG
jgi:hypothetical protein